MWGSVVESSSPTATRRPPDESGIFVTIGEADNGSGFLLTGEGLLTLDVCAWNAENDGISLEGVANGFTRVDGAIGFVETAGTTSRRSCWGGRPRSMTTVSMTRGHEMRLSIAHAFIQQ